MFDSWLDFPFEEEETAHDGCFHEYHVTIQTIGLGQSPVFLSVWAEDFDAALTCGEVLSAVYCA
jgi:hypothetical protein